MQKHDPIDKLAAAFAKLNAADMEDALARLHAVHDAKEAFLATLTGAKAKLDNAVAGKASA